MLNPFHLTQRQEDKLQNFKEVPSVSSIMNFSTENKIVEIKSSRGRPKKRNGSNSKLQPTKKGDSNRVYKRSTKNFQPAELGDHEKVNCLDRNSIACGLAKEESASNDQMETAAVFRPGRRTRTSAVEPHVALEWSNIQIKYLSEFGDHEKADLSDKNSIAGGLAMEETATFNQIETAAVPVPGRTRNSAGNRGKPVVALEWSNIQIKFRVIGQDFYDLYPDVDPQSPSYQEDMRKNANSE